MTNHLARSEEEAFDSRKTEGPPKLVTPPDMRLRVTAVQIQIQAVYIRKIQKQRERCKERKKASVGASKPLRVKTQWEKDRAEESYHREAGG